MHQVLFLANAMNTRSHSCFAKEVIIFALTQQLSFVHKSQWMGSFCKWTLWTFRVDKMLLFTLINRLNEGTGILIDW